MINNRQQSGRRRGRGGQRPQGGPGRSDGGNRIDNRARGNAAQLLEKYKALARDSQMGGDRVMTEYYHQFADHYFRVLSESRARFEENRPKRDDDDDDYDEDGRAEMRGDEAFDDDPRDQPYRQQQPRNDRDQQARNDRDQQPRNDRDRQPRNERDQQARPDRQPREPYQDRAPSQPYARDDAQDDERPREASPERPREFERRPRRPAQRDAAPPLNGNGAANGHDGDDVGFNAELLPPSFSAAVAEPEPADEAPAPRRRGRPRKVVDEQPPVE